jgi:transposase
MDEVLVKNKRNYPIHLMFQDEARFGRMSDPRRCWAPNPLRPKVELALVRQYNYIFGAVCPATGGFDWMRATDMKTPNMSLFLKQVSRAHPNKFIVIVLDGASTHKSKSLVVPSNVALIILPPYSPELNPTERIWNQLKKNYFANRYFSTLVEAMDAVDTGLYEMKKHRSKMKSLTFWPWIKEILNAN